MKDLFILHASREVSAADIGIGPGNCFGHIGVYLWVGTQHPDHRAHKRAIVDVLNREAATNPEFRQLMIAGGYLHWTEARRRELRFGEPEEDEE